MITKLKHKLIPVKYKTLGEIKELNKVKLIFTKNKYLLYLGIALIVFCLLTPFTNWSIPLIIKFLVVDNF